MKQEVNSKKGIQSLKLSKKNPLKSSTGISNKKGRIQQKLKRYVKSKYLMLMLVPAIIYYITFHYIPIYGLLIAFKDFKLANGIWASPWVGFEHFRDLFSLGSFWEVLRNTIIISLYKLIWGFPAPIILALLLNELHNAHFKKVVQTISYLPHFLSWVVLGGIFLQVLSPTTGPVNMILKYFKIEPIFFMANPKWFRSVLVITGIWKSVGWGSVIYIASLAGINPELYEACTIDGANRFQKIIHVSIPSLVPVISIMLIFAVGGIINDDFDQIFNMYNEAVYKVADVLSTYIYRVGLETMQFERSTAVGLFKNVIAFTLIVLANSITKRLNDYGIW